jgi:hypothetical protein
MPSFGFFPSRSQGKLPLHNTEGIIGPNTCPGEDPNSNFQVCFLINVHRSHIIVHWEIIRGAMASWGLSTADSHWKINLPPQLWIFPYKVQMKTPPTRVGCWHWGGASWKSRPLQNSRVWVEVAEILLPNQVTISPSSQRAVNTHYLLVLLQQWTGQVQLWTSKGGHEGKQRCQWADVHTMRWKKVQKHLGGTAFDLHMAPGELHATGFDHIHLEYQVRLEAQVC